MSIFQITKSRHFGEHCRPKDAQKHLQSFLLSMLKVIVENVYITLSRACLLCKEELTRLDLHMKFCNRTLSGVLFRLPYHFPCRITFSTIKAAVQLKMYFERRSVVICSHFPEKAISSARSLLEPKLRISERILSPRRCFQKRSFSKKWLYQIMRGM